MMRITIIEEDEEVRKGDRSALAGALAPPSFPPRSPPVFRLVFLFIISIKPPF
jgi:hypothetical protein